MEKDLNSYQVHVTRELLKTSNQYKDIVHTRELWLSINIEYRIETILSWEIEMLLDGFISISDDLLLSQIIEDGKFYSANLPLKLTTKGKEYMASWSVDKIVRRKLSDRVNSLQRTIEEKETGKNQSTRPIVIPNNKEQQKITLAARGIMHVYIKKFEFNGQAVTEQNKNELAADYGFNNKTSGKQLKDDFDKFNNGQEATPKTHLKRLESILPFLKTKYPKAFEAVEKDIVGLKKKIHQ